MSLYEKIIKIYPILTAEDFSPSTVTIILQNEGQGDYIKHWSNSNLQPTNEQLNAIG